MSNGEPIKPPIWKRDIVVLPQWMVVPLWLAVFTAIGYLLVDREEMKERVAIMETKMSMMEKVDMRLEKIENKLDDLQRELYRSRYRGGYAKKTAYIYYGSDLDPMNVFGDKKIEVLPGEPGKGEN